MRLACGNVWAEVEEATDRELAWLEKYLSVPVAGREHSPAYKRRVWDGMTHLFKDGRFLSGLTRLVREAGAKLDPPVEVVARDVRQAAPACAWDESGLGWLRDYQLDGARAGARKTRGIVDMPTGAGKTSVFVAWALGFRALRWLVLVDTIDLVNQAAERFERYSGGEEAGRIGDGVRKIRRFTVATLQSLSRGLEAEDPSIVVLLSRTDGMVVDECFPAGTLVGRMPIELIRRGDVVLSFDPATGRQELRTVVATFRKKATALVRLWFVDGRTLVCTPNHKIWTRQGWVVAEESKDESALVSMREVRSGGPDQGGAGGVRPLLRPLPRGSKGRAEEARPIAVRDLQGAGPTLGTEGPRASANRAGVLLGGAHAAVEARASGPDIARDGASGSGRTLRADEGAEPDQYAGYRREDDRDPACEWDGGTAGQGRQRVRSYGPRGDASGAYGVATGRGRPDGPPAGDRVPDLLQARPCEPGDEARGRGRRGLASGEGPEGAGREEGRPPAFARVDRVEVLEPGGDGTFGGLCPGGLVYDLEVESTHTYFADGVGVSNCHVLPAETYAAVAMRCGAHYRLGTSATALMRGDSRDFMTIGVLGPVFYRVDREALVERGILARATIRFVECRHPSTEFESYAEAYATLVTEGEARNSLVVEMAFAAPKPALVFVRFQAHGHELARRLRRAGLQAEFVWGATSTSARAAACERLQRGEIHVLVTSKIFNKGIDVPLVAGGVNAAGGASEADALQKLGRLMRVSGTKTAFTYYDVLDRSNRWLRSQASKRMAAYRVDGHVVEEIKRDDLLLLPGA